jgi:hypothetical protein
MNSSISHTEPLPFGAACLVAAVLVGCGVWLMLTAFHPRWRRVVHWGRMQKGPPVSLGGRFVVTIATATWAVWLIAYSLQNFDFLHFMQVVGGITSVAFIAAMIHDFVIWK